MVMHGAIGFLIGTLFVGGLLWFGGDGFGGLLWRVGGWPVIALLWFFSGLTFGSAMIGGAVMLIKPEAELPPGGRRARVVMPQLVPARATRRR